MNEVELRQLEYFYKVGTFENFTRAAQLLHVSQPSVTKAIKSLEAELQLTLIDRSQKKISLTEEGKVFFEHTKKIIQAIEDAQQDMQCFKLQKNNVIRFGLPPMVESYLFPNLFIKFQTAHPEISLEIKEFGNSDEILQKLRDGIFDFGIIFKSCDQKNKLSTNILDDEFKLCLAKNHKLLSLNEITFENLRDEKFILQKAGTYQHQKIIEICSKYGYDPKILLCTSQLKTLKQLVAAGTGISFLPSFAISSNENFCQRKIFPSIKFHVTLVWARSKNLPANYKLFIDFVENSFVIGDLIAT